MLLCLLEISVKYLEIKERRVCLGWFERVLRLHFQRQLTSTSMLFTYPSLWWQNEVKIDSLHLGGTPPVFNFVRALERPAEGDHVVSFCCNWLGLHCV